MLRCDHKLCQEFVHLVRSEREETSLCRGQTPHEDSKYALKNPGMIESYLLTKYPRNTERQIIGNDAKNARQQTMSRKET